MTTITLRAEGESLKRIYDLVNQLPDIEVLSNDLNDIDQAWIKEIERRKESLASGKATLITESEALYRAKKKLIK
ncbi:MAG TPA: hypothetical protein DCE78_01880 [Bacteroidetes bacterium]|nr:hypothetical protein [Bacteroidota bacterium]